MLIWWQDFVQDRFTVEREDAMLQIPPELHVCEMLIDQVCLAVGHSSITSLSD